jgi:hypothetical protein
MAGYLLWTEVGGTVPPVWQESIASGTKYPTERRLREIYHSELWGSVIECKSLTGCREITKHFWRDKQCF